MIVSGDDRTKPILGYSVSGSFKEDALPENVEWWLTYYAKAISSLGDSPAVADYKSVTATVRSNVEPLIETQWDQHSPYSDQCVFEGLGQCVTGCVATSMAQVVNFHKYPSSVPAIDAYTSSGYTFDALPATTLNWNNMTDVDIAKLCRYCGQSVEMDYSPNGSSAVSESISFALVKYFGYNKSVHAIYRDGYSPEDWENEIYQEMAAGYPVVYSGRTTTGYGHAFIVDGYQHGLFHVNWGWGGWFDTYFVLTVMDALGPDNPDWTFSEDQTAIVGVRPVKGGTLDYPLMTISQLELAQGQGSEIARGAANENFSASVYFKIDNSANSEDDMAGVGLALYRGNERVQSLMQWGASQQRPGYYYSQTRRLNFGAGLADGTYRIEGVYQDKDKNLHQSQGFGYRYIEAVIKGNKLTLTNYPLIGAVKLSESKVIIQKGKTVTLEATVSPSTLADKSVTWESSNPKVATVTSEGKVKGVKTGTAIITCTSSKGLSATCEVTVGNVTLSQTEMSVGKDKTMTLTATISPSTLADKRVTWKSSDETIATVTADGVVTGVKIGTATITCTTVAMGWSASCKVTVKNGSVTLNKTETSIEKGKTITLKATLAPTTLSDKSVTWKSSNTKVATVTSAGEVTGVKTGTATITCTSNATGLSATCEVTIGKVNLDKSEACVEKGNTLTLTPSVYPETLEDKSVTWTTSDKKVATVSTAGKVKAVGVGTATITCTSNATGLKATCTLTVGKVVLSKSKATVAVGKSGTLKATVYPETLEDKSVTWKSSDTKVATVTSAGKVKAVGIGTAIITCTSNATGLSATCTVTVAASAGTRSLDGDDDELTDIGDMEIGPAVTEPFDVYDLNGRKVKSQVTSLDGLPDGIYIVNGRKVFKKE